VWRASLCLAQVQRWWPAGHGEQVLYPVALLADGASTPLGQVGFRQVAVDRGADGRGFTLVVNGQPVFARGAVFTPPDMCHPGGEAGVPERLRQLADMGANMVRVAGPFCYQSPAFFEACDALGLMVWQDLMLANFDYPLGDPTFLHTLEREVQAQLGPLAAHPSLVVVCGGSEVQQQAAMLGLQPTHERLAFFNERLPALCAQTCPGVVVVANSPTGGDLPFSVREGVSHYFGVGAYERPLDDARRAAPRFVTECLAFSQVPEPCSLEPLGVPAVHHPDWKAGVPRDRHASWDFEDTRDHYLQRLFGLDPLALRRTDAARYLQASRAVTAHVVSTTLSEWRRPASPTAGALVFTAGDLRPGAGWGLIAVDGEPKAAYHGFKQVAQPLALLLTDEGCDGLDIHLVNDTPQAHALVVQVRLLRAGAVVVAQGSHTVTVPGRSGLSLPATRVLGAFLDLTYAFRFGPPGHDAVVVTASPATPTDSTADTAPTPPLQAVFFPLGPCSPPVPLGLQAHAECVQGQWWLVLTTTTLARFVHIDDRTHRPQDNHFHLPPGTPRRVRLVPRTHTPSRPHGDVTALNGSDTVHYQAPAT
jgi:beta-mannosidase